MKLPFVFCIRRRYGCCWQSSFPGRRELSPGWRTVLALLFLLLVYGIMGRLDYEDELKAKVIGMAAQKEEAERRLDACLSTKDYRSRPYQDRRIETRGAPAWYGEGRAL